MPGRYSAHMIPKDTQQWIFPELADGTKDAAVLSHDCGVDFQFRVHLLTSVPFVITREHLQKWRIDLDKVAELAGLNCFSYNTLTADPEGVYHDDDGNTFAILFAPSTFLEHNDVEGVPTLLIISEKECILTGSRSEAGRKLIAKHQRKALAKRSVTIDSRWRKWIAAGKAE